MTMWLRVENVDTAVIRAKEDELRWLSRYLSIEDASAAYRGGGTIELLTPASTFPTGLLDFVLEEATKAGFQVQLMDTRVQPVQYDKTADLSWLRDYQDEAVEWALALSRGIFHHPTGAGKTEIIAAISRMYYCPWLITVNKKDLLYQTAERIERRVGEAPGIVGDGKFDVRRVTVGMYQTLHSDLLGPRKFPWDSIQGWMGDEIHNVAAGTYLRVSSNLINAYWRFGFSGTPLSRSDRKSLLVVAATGKVIHRIRHETLVEAGVLAKPTIRMVPIVHTASILLADWNTAYTHLVVRSAARNEALCALARNAEKPCLLFVKEIEHGHILRKMLQKQGVAVEFVWGEKVTPQRTASIRRLVHGDIDVLIANVIFQEGVDIPELMSVVIGSGGKSPIMCLQDVGRGMRRRNKAGEEVKSEFFVYDIQDKSCGCGTFRDGRWQYEHLSCKWLEQHARLRRRAYISEGYTVVLA